VNADTVAAAIAAALGAEKLVYLTDVNRSLRTVARRIVADIPRRHRGARAAARVGAVSEGMIPRSSRASPRCEAASRAPTCSMVDCRTRCLLEFFTREGVGTMVTP